MELKGAIVAIVTPFNEDGTIDYKSLERLIGFHLLNNTDGIVVCGTTGEAATLTIKEYKEVISFVVRKVNKQIPVIAGSGTNDTNHAIELSKIADEQGVDALLIVTPYYNKPNPNGMYQHYAAIANIVDIPIILYNVPGRTGINLSPAIVQRLANDFSNIVGIKEAAGSIEQGMELIQSLPDDFLIFSGDDQLAFALVCMGADGCISVAANAIPNEFHKLIWHALNGEFEEAKTIQYKYLKFMKLNFIESNPVPIKTVLHLMGYIKEEFRLPLAPIAEGNKKLLKNELISLGILN
jgi:4-hydroxy-tetrahydrodipicolinate synthase